MTARTAATSSAVAVTQPIFQPVNENVLPAELIDTVRSRMPGSEPIGTCSPVVHHVLVDLVRDHEQVALAGQLGDRGELIAGEHRPGRVVRRVQQDQPGPRR